MACRLVIAIDQTLNLEYLLGDHLESTSLTTDSAGVKISEMRYKPFGEVRYLCPLGYAWTNAQATPANYTLMKYTFCAAPLAGTGQYSYLDTPSTPASEGFGLMFYVSRWYDPSLGRFAQADTLVPGGAQGLDRYAYVNNNPIRYNDPSGHKCQPEDECETPRGEKSAGAALTENGKKMLSLYGRWKSTFGYLSVQEFFGWMMYFEMNGLQNNTFLFNGQVTTVLEMMKEVVARQLWGDSSQPPFGGHSPYCSNSACTNGLFNFLGEYAQVARARASNGTLFESDYPVGFQLTNPDGTTEYLRDKLLERANEFTNSVLVNVRPEWKEYNNQLPYHWGNPEWAKGFSGPEGTTDIDGAVYRNGSFVIFTQNQASCQAGAIC